MTSLDASEPTGLRSTSVRQANLATILRLLHLGGPASRSVLAHDTGLTRTSIATLVGDLVALGLVHERAPDPGGKRGRPSPIVHASTDTNVVIGVDVRVGEIQAVAVGLGGTALISLGRERAGTARKPNDDAELVSELVTAVVGELPRQCRLLGIGLAVPGLVDRATERVAIAPNLDWHDINFAGLVRASEKHPAVTHGPLTIGNEADLGALAESRRGTMHQSGNLLYVSGNVGIGGGIVADGLRLTGAHGFAGEIGHIPVNPTGALCACGANGCFETEIGERALLDRAGIDGSGPASIAAFLERLDADDPTAVAALEAHVRWLGFGLSAALRLLDADTVVLGGLLGRLLGRMQPALDVALADRALLTETRVAVTGASLGQDAPALGAAEATWDRILADPEQAIAAVAVA